MVAATIAATRRKKERSPKTRPRSSSCPDLTPFSLFSLLFFGLYGCSDYCCQEKKEGEKCKDETAIFKLPGLDQHQGGRCDQVEGHPKQVDDCRSVRAG